MASNPKRVCVDIGGTFTDILVLDEVTGQFTLVKSPTTPSDPSDGFLDGMAKAAGYANVFSFDNLEDFTTGIDEVLASEGPVFIQLSVTPEIENTPVAFRPNPCCRTREWAVRRLPHTHCY